MTAHNILSEPASRPPAYEFEAKMTQEQESITNGYLIVAKDKAYTPTHITGVEVFLQYSHINYRQEMIASLQARRVEWKLSPQEKGTVPCRITMHRIKDHHILYQFMFHTSVEPTQCCRHDIATLNISGLWLQTASKRVLSLSQSWLITISLTCREVVIHTASSHDS